LPSRNRETSGFRDLNEGIQRSQTVHPRTSIVGDIPPSQPQAGNADWQVDEKDAAPSNQRYQCAAKGQPCSKRDGAGRQPPADGAAALFGLRIGVVEQR
jgi:hypothetical protein